MVISIKKGLLQSLKSEIIYNGVLQRSHRYFSSICNLIHFNATTWLFSCYFRFWPVETQIPNFQIMLHREFVALVTNWKCFAFYLSIAYLSGLVETY